MTKTVRKIVNIDEEKCDGCGACLISCAEGALQLVDGKAKLVGDKYCDGLGACLGECPRGAITVEEREAEAFDEDAAKEHLNAVAAEEKLACGCSSAAVTRIARPEDISVSEGGTASPSMLTHWPVQLALVPPSAPFLQGADVLLVGDCVPFTSGGFHRDFVRGHSVLVACPKLDDFPAHLERLTGILRQSDIRSITVVHMEVPCCSGLVHMARQAIEASGKDIPLSEVTIDIKGEVKAG